MITSLPPAPAVRVVTRPSEPSPASFARADAVAILIERAKGAARALRSVPGGTTLQALWRAESKSGNEWPLLATRLPNRRNTLVVVGFLKAEATGFERLDFAGKLAHELVRPGAETVLVHALGFAKAGARVAAVESMLSALLAHAAPMPESKTKASAPASLARIDLAATPDGAFDRAIAESAGNHLARWLATLPPNVLDTLGYRDALQALAAREGWTFRFQDIDALEQAGAGAFLAVARANPHRGAGIAHLSYRPPGTRGRNAAPGVALVGKGICFDTGGINLKSHKSMFTMHGDMQGSSVALGTMLALARLEVPYAIDCWLAITENQIGPTAFRPQEVVRAANGVTIQVVHSDAEGRMVLADTLALASRSKPRLMLDFATLTGACVVAITDRYAGAFTNRPVLHDWLQRTGRDSGERVWCFPMDEDFDVELESKVADVLQCSADSKGDHILAARFLGRFVDADVPWVHVDLAAAERKGGLGHVPTEFTGFGVRYAVHLLGDLAGLDARLQAQA